MTIVLIKTSELIIIYISHHRHSFDMKQTKSGKSLWPTCDQSVSVKWSIILCKVITSINHYRKVYLYIDKYFIIQSDLQLLSLYSLSLAHNNSTFSPKRDLVKTVSTEQEESVMSWVSDEPRDWAVNSRTEVVAQILNDSSNATTHVTDQSLTHCPLHNTSTHTYWFTGFLSACETTLNYY